MGVWFTGAEIIPLQRTRVSSGGGFAEFGSAKKPRKSFTNLQEQRRAVAWAFWQIRPRLVRLVPTLTLGSRVQSPPATPARYHHPVCYTPGMEHRARRNRKRWALARVDRDVPRRPIDNCHSACKGVSSGWLSFWQ